MPECCVVVRLTFKIFAVGGTAFSIFTALPEFPAFVTKELKTEYSACSYDTLTEEQYSALQPAFTNNN